MIISLSLNLSAGEEATNSDLSRLQVKASNIFCARRRGWFVGVFWDAFAKRLRRKGRRGSHLSRRCPIQKRLTV
jgi:hypothetical protein